MFLIEKNKAYYSSLVGLMRWYAYPESFAGNGIKRLNIQATIINTVAVLLCTLPGFIHFVVYEKEHIEGDVSEDLMNVVEGFASVWISTTFTSNVQKWSAFFHKICNIDKFGKPSDFDQTIKRTNLLSKVYQYYCMTGVFTYITSAAYEAYVCEKLNQQRTTKLFCISMLNTWFPSEVTNVPIRIIFFGMQGILCGKLLFTVAIIIYLSWETSQILTSHIRLLRSMLHDVFLETTYIKRKKKLNHWITYHVHILEMLKEFNKLNKMCNGPCALTAAIHFGCIANQVMNRVKILGAITDLIGWLTGLLLACSAGQHLTDESEKLCNEIYAAQWYEADIPIMKDILFILSKTQVLLKLESLPLGDFNYELYLAVLKTSYSFLGLLINST